MTQTTVTTNIHQAFDIELYFLPEIPFNPALLLDNLPDSGALFFR